MTAADLSNLVVEVLHNRGDDNHPAWSVGSGFFVGTSLVLTALHNVDGPGELLVRIHGTEEHSEEHSAVVRLQGNKDMDLAVLEVSGVAVDVPPLRYAEVDRNAARVVKECWAVGFPWFKEQAHDPKPLRLSAQVDGEIPTGENLDQLLLTLQVRRSPRPLPSGSVRESEWAGISGATVFSGYDPNNYILVGVITEHHLAEGESALTVVPIAALKDQHQLPEAEATKWWKLLGVDPQALVPLPGKAPSSPSHEQDILWNVPYRQNGLFTDREDVLNQLHEHFTRTKTSPRTQPQAITGLGGIGKTQIAIEYAYRHRGEYHYVLWVNATTRETLIEGFLAIARLLALPAKDEQDQRIAVAAVQQWFVTHDQWLLILDNAEDSTLISEFLPTGETGHILLTTREPVWGPVAESCEVKEMSETEAIKFLLRRVKILDSSHSSLSEVSSADQASAAAIVKEMGGLPLALDQAGAYIEETPSTLDGYLKAYKRRQQELLQDRGDERWYHPYAVTTTWSLNFEQVERLSPMAADLLRFFAFLAPDAIDEDMILAAASELGPNLQPLATDETLLDKAIKPLSHFSLVQRHTGKHFLVIHRLVQVVLKASMSEETQRQWAERTVRAVNRAFPTSEYTNWSRYARLLPHALACEKLIETYALAFPEAAQLLNQTGIYLQEHAQYPETERLLQQALAIRKKVLGLKNSDTAQSLNNLGYLYNTLDEYEQAKPLLEQALAIRKEVLGLKNSDTAQSLTNLGYTYYMLNNYEQAKPLLEQALAIRKEVLGPEDPNTVITLNTLAKFYQKQRNYEQAELLWKQALEIRKKVLPVDHPHISNSLTNLAGLYLEQDLEQDKYKQAESLLEQALEIREKVLGPNNLRTAQSLANLGYTYYMLNKDKQAESLLQRALAIFEQVLGKNHHTTQTVHTKYLALQKKNSISPPSRLFPASLRGDHSDPGANSLLGGEAAGLLF